MEKTNNRNEVKNPYGEDKEAEAIWECLKRMYKEAEPSADIREIMKTGEGKMPKFFMAYFLSEVKIEMIIHEVCKEFKIKAYKIQKVRNTIYLGCCPNSYRKTWKKEREDYDKRLEEFLKSNTEETAHSDESMQKNGNNNK